MLSLPFLFADVDECDMKENICGANSTCQNYDDGFNCTCDTGFEMIDGSCLGELYYRPQRSCGKVMFLHMSVILSTGPLDPPPADTFPQTATEADGTHPTGMHSCLRKYLS